MAIYVKGDSVQNATSYELLEKTAEGAYTSLAEKNEINFALEDLQLAEGDHTLVVKAKADGYETSDPSNEVVYTVPAIPVVNLYNADNFPVQMCYYGNSPTVSAAKPKIVQAGGNRVTKTVGLDVCEFPVESGKTYTIKLFNAPTTATANGDTDGDGILEEGEKEPSTIPYFGIVGFFFYEVIDDTPSVRYAYSPSNNPQQWAYWSTAKHANYTGDIPISETNDPSVFGITQSKNPGTIVITNLATGAKNTDSDKSMFGPTASMYTQSCQVEILDENIKFMTILLGNPSNTMYQMASQAGILSDEDRAEAIEIVQNGLVISEGKKIPNEYVAYEG